MNSFLFLSGCYLLILTLFIPREISACQPQVCRRKRAAVTDGTLKLKLVGCDGESPPWIRQIAYCLNLSVTPFALRIKDWYIIKYAECADKGCSEYVDGTRDKKAIDDCVKCWEDIIDSDDILGDFNLTPKEVNKCIDKYIYAFLDPNVPILTTESRNKHHIDLASIRPEEYWWSVTVELPCKPKTFVYWNALCINSFANNLREGDYVLVQNKLITADRITFYVEFSETCTFEPEQIHVVYKESTPAESLAQTSSFPTKIPPDQAEEMKMFFDRDSAERLIRTSGNKIPAEYVTARKTARRIKRDVGDTRINLSKIGVAFPCAVRSFFAKTVNQDEKPPFRITGGGDRFLIKVTNSSMVENENWWLNFTLDYGYDQTGCIFDSGDTVVVPNPPPGWLTQSRVVKKKRKNQGITCVVCDNMENDHDCLYRGRTRICGRGEVCQTEIRQTGKDKKRITKACKQKHACRVDVQGRNDQECRPGQTGSVCRCCCDTYMCNAGNRHHSGDLFICKNS